MMVRWICGVGSQCARRGEAAGNSCSRYLEFWEAGGSVNQVGGLDALKGWLEEGRGFTDEARQFGLPQPKGLFLLGVQESR